MANTKPSSSFLGITDANDGWKPVSTSAPSAASNVDFTSMSTYDMYRVIFEIADMSADASDLGWQISTDNGSTFISGGGNYKHSLDGYKASNANIAAAGTSESRGLIFNNYDTDVAVHYAQVDLIFYNLGASDSDTRVACRVHASWFHNTTTNSEAFWNGVSWYTGGQTGPFTAIRLLPSSGTLTGSVRLLGMDWS